MKKQQASLAYKLITSTKLHAVLAAALQDVVLPEGFLEDQGTRHCAEPIGCFVSLFS